MDDPFLIFILIAIVWQLVGGLFGAGKKKGPTEPKPPPERVKRPRPAPPGSRPARTSRLPEQLERPRTGGRSQKEGPVWWEAARQPPAPTAGGTLSSPAEATPTPSAPSGRSTSRGGAAGEDVDRPWWETPEAATGGARPGQEWADTGPDDPHRPSDPVVRTPEELWEILTGQRSPFPVPRRPPPEPESEPEAVGRPREGIHATRPEPVGDEDVVTLEGESLEATEISSEGRHEAFHRKIDVTPRPRRRVPTLDRLGLDDRTDVRRAVVLAEVLGKPRSLVGPDW